MSDMSAINPHYRTVQQLLQSQSFAIDEYHLAHFTKAEQLARRELLKTMIDQIWSPTRLDALSA